MIRSPMGNPIVQECRGLILDRHENWSVLSFPFRKFFNYGEGHAATIDWSTARAEEKVDGSLVTLYEDRRGVSENVHLRFPWRIQTLGEMDASGRVNRADMIFRDLFIRTFSGGSNAVLDDRLSKLPTGACYTFELATPSNRVVTPYAKDRLVLLSARSTVSLDEWRREHIDALAVRLGVERPNSYACFDMASVVEMAAALPTLEEGYVVVDGAFNRVKVKNPAYIAIAHMKDSAFASRRGLLEMARGGGSDDFLSIFPEMQSDYDAIMSSYENAIKRCEDVYEAASVQFAPSDMKGFAVAIQAANPPSTAPLFALRRGKTASIRSWFDGQPSDKVLEVLGGI